MPNAQQTLLLSAAGPGSKALRKTRTSLEGQTYLLTTTTMYRRAVFRDPEVSFAVCKALNQSWLWRDSQLLAWVLMPDHWHGLLRLGRDDDLSTLMGRFKSVTARAVPQRFRINGWLWNRGFHDRALHNDEGVRETARYLVTNPLRAGLVEEIANYPFWDAAWIGSRSDSICPL